MKAFSSPALKSQRLRRRVWALALLVLVLMFSTSGSLYLLSAVRGFVNGESLWSKAQKDAIYALSRYADEGNPSDLARYQNALLVPRGEPKRVTPSTTSPCVWTLRAKALSRG